MANSQPAAFERYTIPTDQTATGLDLGFIQDNIRAAFLSLRIYRIRPTAPANSSAPGDPGDIWFGTQNGVGVLYFCTGRSTADAPAAVWWKLTGASF